MAKYKDTHATANYKHYWKSDIALLKLLIERGEEGALVSKKQITAIRDDIKILKCVGDNNIHVAINLHAE